MVKWNPRAEAAEKALGELADDYLAALKENNIAWQEAARLGKVIAQYDARVKTRVDSDTRLRAAEETARVMTSRMTAVDVFWTGLLNGEYDEGHIPAPTLPAAELDDEEEMPELDYEAHEECD